jgi:hypothetical protein
MFFPHLTVGTELAYSKIQCIPALANKVPGAMGQRVLINKFFERSVLVSACQTTPVLQLSPDEGTFSLVRG